jgi:hypothetical protein
MFNQFAHNANQHTNSLIADNDKRMRRLYTLNPQSYNNKQPAPEPPKAHAHKRLGNSVIIAGAMHYSPVILGFDLEQIRTEFIFAPPLSISYPVFQKKVPSDPSGGSSRKRDFNLSRF